MKKRKGLTSKCILATLWLLSCCFLTGCQDEVDRVKSDELPVMPDEPEVLLREIEKVGVYTDVTPSMMGFLGMNTDSYRAVVGETVYMKCLDEVNNFILINFDEEIISYYRVDTPTWKAEENVLEQAKKRGYYSDTRWRKENYELVDLIEEDGEGPASWCLSNALKNCEDDDFSVFITDLYENKRKVSEVITALKENMTISEMPDGKTVGIVGIKSQYAGTIYDYNDKKEGVEYGIVEGDVTEEDICYRQFYVISIGFPEEVRRFCQSLIDNMYLNEGDIESAIFYEDPIYGLDFTDYNRYHFQEDSSSGYVQKEGYVIVNDEAKMSIYGCGKKSEEGKDIVVSYRVEGVSLQKQLESGQKGEYSLPGVGETELNEMPYRIEEKKVYMWVADKGGFNELENHDGVYQIENVLYSPEEKLLYVWFKVFEENIPKSTLKFSCQVVLENRAELGDDWVEQWEVKNEEEDCGKTKKLGDFFDELKEKMPEVNKTLLEFVFYLNY